MSFLMRWAGLVRIVWCLLCRRKIAGEEYRSEYDTVSATYEIWQARMGGHTDLLLEPPFVLPSEGPLRILDLACGAGYLTSKLLAMYPNRHDMHITGVDFSAGMIGRCQATVHDKRARFVRAEGSAYLRSVSAGYYHAIVCGWGLVYFDHRKILPLCSHALCSGGLMAAIMNCRGTLHGVESAFLQVMAEEASQVRQVMDIRTHLPADERRFVRWFGDAGFQSLYSGTGEEVVVTTSAEDLYRWIRDSGAIAGTRNIFADYAAIEPRLIRLLGERLRVDNGFQVNHRYVYGVFRRG